MFGHAGGGGGGGAKGIELKRKDCTQAAASLPYSQRQLLNPQTHTQSRKHGFPVTVETMSGIVLWRAFQIDDLYDVYRLLQCCSGGSSTALDTRLFIRQVDQVTDKFHVPCEPETLLHASHFPHALTGGHVLELVQVCRAVQKQTQCLLEVSFFAVQPVVIHVQHKWYDWYDALDPLLNVVEARRPMWVDPHNFEVFAPLDPRTTVHNDQEDKLMQLETMLMSNVFAEKFGDTRDVPWQVASTGTIKFIQIPYANIRLDPHFGTWTTDMTTCIVQHGQPTWNSLLALAIHLYDMPTFPGSFDPGVVRAFLEECDDAQKSICRAAGDMNTTVSALVEKNSPRTDCTRWGTPRAAPGTVIYIQVQQEDNANGAKTAHLVVETRLPKKKRMSPCDEFMYKKMFEYVAQRNYSDLYPSTITSMNARPGSQWTGLSNRPMTDEEPDRAGLSAADAETAKKRARKTWADVAVEAENRRRRTIASIAVQRANNHASMRRDRQIRCWTKYHWDEAEDTMATLSVLSPLTTAQISVNEKMSLRRTINAQGLGFGENGLENLQQACDISETLTQAWLGLPRPGPDKYLRTFRDYQEDVAYRTRIFEAYRQMRTTGSVTSSVTGSTTGSAVSHIVELSKKVRETGTGHNELQRVIHEHMDL